MNPRIKELVKQATRSRLVGRPAEFDPEYFAELIVHECSNISTTTCQNMESIDDGTLPGYKTVVNTYMLVLRRNLANKFKVDL